MSLRLAALLALLGVTGWLHGRWTDRWGDPGYVAAAAMPLREIPLEVGDWEGKDISPDESELAYKASDYQVIRRYRNRTTGASVGFLMTCGRPSGMIIEHNPKTCYEAQHFEEPTTGHRIMVGPSEEQGEFFAHTFIKTTPATISRLRLLWSWGDGKSWTFPDAPRIAFSRKPILYKMYVTRSMLSEEDPLDKDPIISFLSDMLPHVNATLNGRQR